MDMYVQCGADLHPACLQWSDIKLVHCKGTEKAAKCLHMPLCAAFVYEFQKIHVLKLF